MPRFFPLGFLAALILLAGCAKSSRYAQYTTTGRKNARILLTNDSLSLAATYPADYAFEQRVSYQEHRAAKKLLPKRLRVKQRYLLYKAEAEDPDYTHYTWRLPLSRINTEVLAASPLWKENNGYFYTIDTTRVPGTALMASIYPTKEAHYIFLIKARAEEPKRPLSFKTDMMLEEYFEILDSLQLRD